VRLNQAVELLCALATLVLCVWPAQAQIINSKHNLSASGPGPIKAFGEDSICVFCHWPHNSTPSTPRWNRSLTNLGYTPYSSSTLDAAPGQPTNISKLCLSCHDGTIGLGVVLSRATPISMTAEISGRAELTTDLSDDHPVSFVYDFGLAAADRELVDPGLLTGSVKLDAQDQMQCTSCHEPHSSDYPKLLVMDPAFGALCVTCHDKAGWPGSSHETSPATWGGMGVDPWPHTDQHTVAANACESCHTPHDAASFDWLWTYYPEEETCFACHEGTVAGEDIGSELTKASSHAVDSYTGVHDPVEDFGSMGRHVECQDCHNPHAASSGSASAPNVSGPLQRVAGVTAEGGRIESANYEYEICFRCHSDNPNIPLPTLERQKEEPNLRLKFSLSNPSFHPVERQGKNSDVPSLIPPWDESSIMYCTDCHNNDDSPGVGGGGPNGPHGSRWPFLLDRRYETDDNTRESATVYAQCYRCHSRSRLLNTNITKFEDHEKHIQDEDTPCSVCHDPHGVQAGAPGGDHTHLINFRTDVVFPSGSGRLEFRDLGDGRGECYLDCHGKDHDSEDYGN
jgi:predicted CXXCH cytochrome family protein